MINLQTHIDQLFDVLPKASGSYCRNPVTGGTFVRGEGGADSIARQKREALKALSAREQFRLDGPQNASPLPLTCIEIDEYRNARGMKGVIGFYARSLMINNYDESHPSFYDFACGLMAGNSGSWHIEEDEMLKKLFPPRRLEGMTGGMYWEKPSARVKSRRRRKHHRAVPQSSTARARAMPLIRQLRATR